MKNAQATKATAANVAAAAAKPARTTRKPVAPVAIQTSAAAVSAKVVGVPFVITQMARPSAGRHLYAFTHAALTMLGMYDGKAVDRATLTNVVGATAVSYHTTKTQAFALTNEGITLNGSYGVDYFMERQRAAKFDPKDVEAYTEIMTTGKMDNRLVKNSGAIKANTK